MLIPWDLIKTRCLSTRLYRLGIVYAALSILFVTLSILFVTLSASEGSHTNCARLYVNTHMVAHYPGKTLRRASPSSRVTNVTQK